MNTLRIVGDFGGFATGTVTFVLSLTISAQGQTWLIDFGSSSTSDYRSASVINPDNNGHYWNSVGYNYYRPWPNLLDVNANTTSAALLFDYASGNDSYGGPAGTTFNPTDAVFNAAALGDLGVAAAVFDYYVNSGFEIQGLDPTKQYNLTFFGSHAYSADNATAYSVCSDKGYTNVLSSVSLNVQIPTNVAQWNTNQVAVINNVSPQTNAVLYIKFAGANGNLGYLNCMEITTVSGGSGSSNVTSAANQIIFITKSNGQIVLTWNCRGSLETANDLNGSWTNVPGATSPYTNTIAVNQQFYRVNQTVDATSLHKKVLCGYQGWFRCPGDGGSQWIHWSRNAGLIASNTLTVEMWPDLSEYTSNEMYAAGTFTYLGGAQAYLFSSQNQQTVDRHFDWMLQYGIDGVFVQRFVSDIQGRPWMTNVLNYARAAADRTGRAFALTYDMTGQPTNTLLSVMTNDWNQLVKVQHLTDDPRYLHHNGKPVLMLWGFFTDRFTTNFAQQIIAAFKTNVTLVGGCEWYWRTDTAPGWGPVFRSFDVILPWNTGNTTIVGTNKYATINYWPADIAAANAAGMLYLPDIWPGFSWDNLQQLPPGTSKIPRLGGDLFWDQFYVAVTNGLDMAYIGMFDEVDEGTAIFKVTNAPPTQGYFVTYEGLPSDWYLRLAAEGTKMLAGERPVTSTIPITP